MNSVYSIIFFSFLADIILGDPYYRYHPVRVIGVWAEFLEKKFLDNNFASVLSGLFFWVAVVLPVCSLFYGFYALLKYFQAETLIIIFQVFTVYSSIAFRDMIRHSLPVYEAMMKNDMDTARTKLQKIVGRDTASLDKSGISSACVESISESFMDGFLSPLLMYFAGVLTGILFKTDTNLVSLVFIVLYRCSNTLDSMVGYKNIKYENFGKFSARVDDIFNFLPARTSFIFIIPAVIVTGQNVLESVKTFLKDRLKSSSPNAGHPISLFSGALQMKLGGNAFYSGIEKNKPFIGDVYSSGGPEKIKAAINLYLFSGISSIFIICLLLYFIVR